MLFALTCSIDSAQCTKVYAATLSVAKSLIGLASGLYHASRYALICAAILSRGCMIENDSKPSWFKPATADDPSEVAAIQHAGCGLWYGFGVIIRRGNLNVGLSHSKYSSRHMAQMISIASAHSARECSRSTWNAACSIGVDRPVPHSTRPFERMSAVATFSATRIGGVNACGISVTPNPRRRFS